MAAPPLPAARLELVLERFSASVRGLRTLGDEPVTAWRIAHELIRDHDYGGEHLLPLDNREGERRPLSEWLVLVSGLYDLEAVAATTSQVVDGRLTLLGLRLVNDEFDDFLRTTRLGRRLERDLGFPHRQVLRGWAIPSAPTEHLPIWTLEYATFLTSCALDPRGRLLAAGAGDGSVVVWDLSSGERRATLRGDPTNVRDVAFSPDGSILAVAGNDGGVRLWDARSGALATLGRHQAGVYRLGFSPDGALLLTLGFGDPPRLWDIAGRAERAVLAGHSGPVRVHAFDPDGARLATGGDDGTIQVWDAETAEKEETLDVLPPVTSCGFSPDGRLLAWTSSDSVVRVWTVGASPSELEELEADDRVYHCAFNSDGSLLATVGGSTTRIWDVELGIERVAVPASGTECAFSPDGRVFAVFGSTSISVHDVASGHERAAFEAYPARAAFGRSGGLLADAGSDQREERGVAHVWEEVAQARLPAVVPDAVDGDDLLGVGADAAALASVIAASGTTPPLSIGLFGDWGSGKTFLIRQIQEQIRRLAVRSRHSTDTSSFCGYVRNVEFNAWHYADGNLWASLVTHIFEELAKPEPAAGVTSAERARDQLARLEASLAAQSALREQLDRARAHSQQTEATRKLLWWTWGLAGADGEAELAEVRRTIDSVGSLRGLWSTLRILLPNRRAWLLVVGGAVALGAALAGGLVFVGADRLWQLAGSAGAAVAAFGGWAVTAAARVRRLVPRVGPTAQVDEVRREDVEAGLAAARAREGELRQELADLAAGRRLARFASERAVSEDYRSHLGLVSRIHDDFLRMSELLADQAQRQAAAETKGAAAEQAPPAEPSPQPDARRPSRLLRPARGALRRLAQLGRRLRPLATQATSVEPVAAADEAEASDLPRIDRIVLYIDDLDRCPPKRVVEVLEAVHLILALPLFVVVLAVDPRWLIQSLELHYTEILKAGTASSDGAAAGSPVSGAADSAAAAAWESTPVNYLEKIIQVPFALRPMGPSGVSALVDALLPVAGEARTGTGDGSSAPAPGEVQESAGTADDGRPGPPGGYGALLPAPRAAPSLTPRSLGLTQPERDFATAIAPALPTPRTVKKFTNLYRLVRARLDEHSGELDGFLDEEGTDIPEYQAVLILLATIICFPKEASKFLLDLGDLSLPATADTSSWSDHVEALRGPDPEKATEIARFLDSATRPATNWTTSTREPFRRWALEISRYSFATGQEVFARHHASSRGR